MHLVHRIRYLKVEVPERLEDRDERIRQLLKKLHASGATSMEDLMVEMYDDLIRNARSAMRNEGYLTWTTRDLAHQVWLAVPDRIPKTVEDRRALVRYLGRVQRSVLIDYARRRKALRRGSGMRPLTIEGIDIPDESVDDCILDISRFLEDLESDPENETAVEVLQMRLFLGMTETEIAETLGISRATVQRRWRDYKPFLYEILGVFPDEEPPRDK